MESALAGCHQVSLVEANLDAYGAFRELRPELVFNIAEGLLGNSREAHIPAMLDMPGIPYTEATPSLGICLDKRRTKEVLAYQRIPTPRFSIVQSLREIPTRLRYPLMVKPTLEGSSEGVTTGRWFGTAGPLFARSTGSWAPTGNRHWWRSFFPDASSQWPFWATALPFARCRSWRSISPPFLRG